MIQVLYAVAAGAAIAVTALLLGLPDWTAALAYVIGMGATLLVREKVTPADKTSPKMDDDVAPHWPRSC